MKRKKYLIFMLVFMILCNTVWAGSRVDSVHAEGTSVTIIENGDFEAKDVMAEAVSATGNPKYGDIGDSCWGWYASSKGTTYQVVQDISDSNDTKMLKVLHDTTLSENAITVNGTIRQSYDTSLEAGATYQIRISAKAVGAGSTAKLRFTVNGKDISASDLMASSCVDWNNYTYEYIHEGEDTKKQLEIKFYYIAGDGYWLLDDISIEKISYQNPIIAVSSTTLSLDEETTGELTATLIDEACVLGATPAYDWTSSDDTVATVTGNGATATVTALRVSAEPVTITVTAKNADASKSVSASCSVTVTAKEDTGKEETAIIANGDFEAGSVMDTSADATDETKPGPADIGDSGWKWYASAKGSKYQVIQDTGDTANSSKVMKVLHDATLSGEAPTVNGTIRFSYADKLEDGEKYTVSARVKAVNAINSSASASKMRFILNGKAATNDLMASDCAEWKEISFVYTQSGNDAKKCLEITMYYIAGGGYWLLDDISIEKWQPKETTIKINPTSLKLEKGNSEELNALLTIVGNDFGEGTTYTWISEDNTLVNVSGSDTKATVTAIKAGIAAIIVTAQNADNSKSVSAKCIVKVSDPEDTENEMTAIIVNGSFEKDALMSEAVIGIGGYKASNIGYYGWESVPSAVGTTYQIIEEPDNTNNKVLKVMHDSTVSNCAITANGSFRQSYATRYPNGLEADVKYIISIRAKAVNASNPSASESNIQFNLNNKRVGSNLMANDCSDWKEYSFEYVQEGADSKKYLQIAPCNIAGDGYWLIDNISIKKAPVVTIDKAEINLEIDSETEIIATILDDDKVLGENPTLRWSSNDTSVATVVEENGMVYIKAVGVGEAVITVKSLYAGVSVECAVKVIPKKIIVNGDFASELASWTTGTDTDVDYTSVAEGRTDNALKIAPKSIGAAVGLLEQSLDAKVTEGMLSSDIKYIVTVYAKPVGANSDSTVIVSWHDSDTATAVTNEIMGDATVDNDGWIKITKEFTAGDVSVAGTKLAVQVSNLTSGYWLFDDISVKRVPYVSVTPAEMNIIVGEKAEIDATMIDQDHILTTGNAFDYNSADESIAKVDLRGRVTGVSSGTTTITITNAYDANYSTTCRLTVNAVDLTAIVIPNNLNLCVAEQQTLDITFAPANATDKNISWTSSDPTVVAVDANGMVTGIKEGSSTITATGAGNVMASCNVTVHKSNTLLTREVMIESTTYQEIVGSFIEFVTNNTDDKATYSLYEAPVNGVLTVEADGSFSYIPVEGQVGDSDSFTVIVNAGTEYEFIIGNVELVERLGSNNSDENYRRREHER